MVGARQSMAMGLLELVADRKVLDPAHEVGRGVDRWTSELDRGSPVKELSEQRAHFATGHLSAQAEVHAQSE